MSLVNPASLEVIASIGTGPDPHEMVITPDQRFAYLSNYAPPGNTISVIALPARRHLAQISTGEFARIHGAALAPDGRHAYFTAGQSGHVVEIDLRANRVTRALPTGGAISHMVVVAPDGRRLYTANIESQNVSVIAVQSGELMAQVPCDQGCEGMAFTPDGKWLWVANQDAGSVTIIEVATNRVAGTMSLPGVPLRIRFTRDGALALVTDWRARGELIVVDARARREVKRLAVGNQPIGVEISPDGRRAFVSNMGSDEIHVIDMKGLEVEQSFRTGRGPDALAWWYPPR